MSDEHPTSEVKITGDGNVVGDSSLAQVVKAEGGSIGDVVQIGQVFAQSVYPPSPKEAPRPSQLPLDLPTFTGRDAYLLELDGLLQPGAGQTVSLVGLRGTAGVGKSVLAVHAAHRWGDRFRDGVVWVDLRQRDVPSALRHVASTYGYSDQAA